MCATVLYSSTKSSEYSNCTVSLEGVDTTSYSVLLAYFEYWYQCGMEWALTQHLYMVYRIPSKFRNWKVLWLLLFLHVRKTFLYVSSRWHCSNMDKRESMRDSAKVFHKVYNLPRNFSASWYMVFEFILAIIILL